MNIDFKYDSVNDRMYAEEPENPGVIIGGPVSSTGVINISTEKICTGGQAFADLPPEVQAVLP